MKFLRNPSTIDGIHKFLTKLTIDIVGQPAVDLMPCVNCLRRSHSLSE